MKYRIISLVLASLMMLAVGQNKVSAQIDSRNRVASTIVADVLNELPAKDAETFDRLMSEVINPKSNRIIDILLLLQPEGSADNAKIEYALQGIANYVSRPDKTDERQSFRIAIRKYIEKPDVEGDKEFVLSLLQTFGDENDAVILLGWADDAEIGDAAVRTLASIPQAKSVVSSFLNENEIKPTQRGSFAYVVGRLGVSEMEGLLLSWIKKADDATLAEIYYALSLIGTKNKSMPVLAKAAKRAKYSLDTKGATTAYFGMLDRFAAEKDTATIEKASAKLMKVKKANVKAAGMNLLVAVEGEKAVPHLIKMLDDKDRQVRCEALRLMAPYSNEEMCASVVQSCAKLNSNIDAVRWLAEVNDQSQIQFIIEQLSSDDPELVETAIRAIVSIDNHDGMMALVPFFAGQYKEVVLDAMKSYNGKLGDVLNMVIKGSVKQKMAVMELLQYRTCYEMYYYVNKNVKNNDIQSDFDKMLKDAAFKALVGVVRYVHVDYLKSLLESCEPQYVESVQNAMEKALYKATPEQCDDFVYGLKNVSLEMLPRYFKVFAYLGNERGVNKIIEGYLSNNGKTEALEALLSIDDYSIASVLYDIAVKDMENRDVILKRYIELVKKADIDVIDKVSSYRNVLGLGPDAEIVNYALRAIESTQTYQGIMMASPYLNDETTAQAAANTILNIATKHPEFNGKEIKELLLKIRETLNDDDAIYKRTQIDQHLEILERNKIFTLSEEEAAEGFVVLFDGTNLDKWQGDKTDYIVQNGNIYVTANYGDEGNLYTEKEYSDFIYRFEFCFTRPGVNNGVGIRTPMHADAAYYGMEIQILDHDAPIYKGLRDYQVHGSVYGVIPAKRLVFPELGTWNTEEIYAKGDHIRVTVNGEVILDGDIRKACNGRNMAPEGKKGAVSGTIDHNNHPGLFNKKGYISFCGHGEGLLIRNVRIKEL
ncbi:MAG: DUF1080 domain-containing protein [Candidatus Limimorpha sp.]